MHLYLEITGIFNFFSTLLKRKVDYQNSILQVKEVKPTQREETQNCISDELSPYLLRHFLPHRLSGVQMDSVRVSSTVAQNGGWYWRKDNYRAPVPPVMSYCIMHKSWLIYVTSSILHQSRGKYATWQNCRYMAVPLGILIL